MLHGARLWTTPLEEALQSQGADGQFRLPLHDEVGRRHADCRGGEDALAAAARREIDAPHPGTGPMMGALSGVTGRRQAVCNSTWPSVMAGKTRLAPSIMRSAADADGSRSKPTSSSVVPVHRRPLGFLTR